jgi:quercetin dioxygenase-like cupin family protein
MIFKNEEITRNDLGDGVSRKVIAHGGKIMAVEVSFEKGAIGLVHTHEHEQVCYVLDGRFKVTIDGKESILAKGDSYYTRPNAPHGVLALEKGKLLDVFTPQRDEFLKQ